MFVTTLNFSQVLERFYEGNKYDFLLLFVSSFDGKDKEILERIVDNSNRINRITGEKISFFYFVQGETTFMDGRPVRLVWDIFDRRALYNEGVDITMDTADDICRFFGILRSDLPAFVLIHKDRHEALQVFSIKDYNDFESLLSPLNTVHSYIYDKELIISRYKFKKNSILDNYYSKRRKTVVTQLDVDKRLADRKLWCDEIERLESRKRMELSRGELDRANRRDVKIAEYRKKLEDYQELVVCGEDESVQYPKDELDRLQYPNVELDDIRYKTIEKLNLEINADLGESIVDDLHNHQGYCNAVLKIWDLVRTRGVRISRVVENIRREIYERGFDVFISCKSQDYAQARAVYEYLKKNGFKPFLADRTLKEIGVDQYTAVIGEVINVCKNMVVFATNVDYLYTPYVHAEWHAFINDINTGHKPNARLVNVLSPDLDIHTLPGWLRDKQCFTTENYKEGLLNYLMGRKSEILQELKKKIEDTYLYTKHELGQERLNSDYMQHRIEEYFYWLVNEKDRMFAKLKKYKNDSLVLEGLRKEIELITKHWIDECHHLIIDIEKCKFDLENEGYEYRCGKNEDFDRYYRKECKFLFIEEDHNSSKIESENVDFSHEIFENFIKHSECDSKSDFKIQEKQECVNKPFVSYNPSYDRTIRQFPKITYGYYVSFIDKLFGRKTYDVYSSIFAPAEVKRNSHMLVQVYLHLEEESEKVISLANESQKDAERRDYIPLQCKLKKGDKVDVLLNIYGESLLMSDKKSMVWQGSFTKCTFDYRVPKDINVDELSCKAILAVGGVPVGEMNFITQIVVDKPRDLNTEIKAHNYSKVFISYAHKDEQAVKFLAKGLEVMKVEHFFDRKYLKAGDIFPQVIEDYINSADLFVLCWSENASQSEYVKKEYTQALGRINSQVKPQNDTKLSIYPISIEPRAELPDAMKNNYHFGEV